jgi:two-component system chemotaxis sensor kinase CheA
VPVGLDGVIKGEVSLAAQEMFGVPAPGQTLWSYLFPSEARRAASFRSAFGQLADDILPFEICAVQMPANIERDGRIVALTYKQIRAGEQFVGVLVLLRDVTAQLEAQRGEEAAREQQAVVGHILRSPQGFRAFLSECDQHIELIYDSSDLAAIKRALHTMKGSCAIFGLRSVAKICHQIEDQIASSGELVRADAERVEAAWEKALGNVSEYVDRDQSRVELQSVDLEGLQKMLHERAEHQAILEMVHTWTFEPVQSIFERLSAQATRIADALGKQVEVAIDADNLRPPAHLLPFWSSLVHVVRNAIDHGIESPDEREAAGKPRAGHLFLNVKRGVDGALAVAILDDGRGMNFAKLADRARRMHLPHASEAELLLAVFADGLSTHDEVTELSGRGVGLGAVRSACQDVGGSLYVQSGVGGTSFSFVFPASALTVPTGAPPARDAKVSLPA